jgi:tRNA uridine 5-carbamoylmethylation protein Kti12
MTLVIIGVIGLPGAGKTTLCKAIVQSPELRVLLASITGLSEAMISMHHISFDEVERETIAASHPEGLEGFDANTWRNSRKRVEKLVSELHALHSESSDLYVVLLDDNFYYRSMRKRFKMHGIVYIERSLNDCLILNRQLRESGIVPEHVIERMALLFEIPDNSESCPALHLRPDMDIPKSELCAQVVHAHDFWSKCTRATKTQSEDPQCISTREVAINTCESLLRKCVTSFTSERVISKKRMKEISCLKARYLEMFKQSIPRQIEHEYDLESLLESVKSEFTRNLIRLELYFWKS